MDLHINILLMKQICSMGPMIPLVEALAVNATPRSENILHSRRKKKLEPRRPSAAGSPSWPITTAMETRRRLGAAAELH
jgi:hypothetical protein